MKNQAKIDLNNELAGNAKRQGSQIDKDAVYGDLLKAFVAYQYRLENPNPKPEETEDFMRMHYQQDPMFHRRVKNLANGVMNILNKYL